MHTIIAIALVSAAQGLLQCSEYCKLISLNQPMKWRPSCDCSVMKKEMLQTNQQRVDTPTKLYYYGAYTSSAYYEPADGFRLSFLDQPFYLINPTAPSMQSLSKSRREEPEINRTVTKNYKRAHVHKIKIETDELPLYLDMDILDTVTQGRSTPQDLSKNLLGGFQATENDLSKCIDLYVIISRKNGISDDIELLNMEQYSGLSDSDLMTILIEKCALPASVIEQSLQEIKGNWGKKNISNAILKNKVNYKSQQKDLLNFSKDLTTNAPYVTSIANIGEFIPDSINNTTIVHGYTINSFGTGTTLSPVKDSKLTSSDTDNEDIVTNHDDVITTKITYQSTTKNMNNNSSPNDFQERTHFNEERYNNNIRYLLTKDTSVLSISINTTDLVSTTENVPNTDFELLIQSHYPKEHKEEHINELNSDKSANTMETLTSISSEDNEVKNPYISTHNNTDKVNNKLIIKENVTHATMHDRTTTRVNRTQYEEGEYQIPKIISKELSNNTLISEVDGNETIPNMDFVAYSKVNNSLENNSHSPTLDDVSSKRVMLENEFKKLREFTTASNIGEIVTEDENIQALASEELINGELLFQYGRKKIPARFVQNSDGKINVAIDGASICDELFKRGENKSLLVSTLCNYVQSRNKTHS